MTSNTSTQPQQSAAVRVLAIHELLEAILAFVPLEQQFSLHRVASSWQATSRRLLTPWTTRTPSEMEEITKRKEKAALKAQEDAIRRSNGLRPIYKLYKPDPNAPSIVATFNTAVLSLDRPDHCLVSDKLAMILVDSDKKLSCDEMFLSYPPAQDATLLWSGDFPCECMEKVLEQRRKGLRGRRPCASTTDYIKTRMHRKSVQEPEGVRVKDIRKAIRDICPHYCARLSVWLQGRVLSQDRSWRKMVFPAPQAQVESPATNETGVAA